MYSRSVVWLPLLFILTINVYCLLCCEKSTFDNTPIILSEQSDGDNFDLINVTGCIDGNIKYTNMELVRAQYTQPIPILNPGAVSNLPKLKIAFFKFNNISAIEPGAFKNLTSLEFLVIVNNSITELKSNTFSDLPVKTLILSNNEINKIDLRAFTNMPNLDSLYLNDNKLQFFYRQWFHKTKNLRSLLLTNNQLLSLPSRAFVNTPMIQLLGFSKNKLQSIHPTTYNGLENLKELDLSKNYLKELPPNVFQSIQSCEYLYLNSNNLTFVYEEHLNDLMYLTAFTIHSNPIQCACMFKIEKWAKDNGIALDSFNRECIVPDNPVCVNHESPTALCVEKVQEDLIEYYYSNFTHAPRNCEDDPTEL